MELDDLKTLWNETQQRQQDLEAALRLSLRLAVANRLDRTRSRLRFVKLVLWYEVAFGALAVLLVGSYLVDNLETARFALPAAVLHLGAILTIAAAARQLVALSRIDYGGPVVEIQRRLATLRVVRARANRGLLISCPLLWALLLVIVPHALLGVDIYRAFGVPWVAGNLAFGAAVLAAVAWARQRFPAWMRSSAFVRWLGDDVTGRRVAEVSGFLGEIEAFEEEG